MSERNLVDFIEEWQTGALLVIGSALVGVVGAVVLSPLRPPYGGVLGFVGGAVLAFLAFSYLLYGR